LNHIIQYFPSNDIFHKLGASYCRSAFKMCADATFIVNGRCAPVDSDKGEFLFRYITADRQLPTQIRATEHRRDLADKLNGLWK
jgi:hypothetical protein